MINYISKDLHEISIMTDNSDLKFCVHCGAELDDGAMFCKSCGAQVERSDAPVTMNPYASMKENSMNNRLKVIGICCIVYAVLAIIGGIVFLVSIDSLMEQVITDPSWPETAQQLIDRFGWCGEFYERCIHLHGLFRCDHRHNYHHSSILMLHKEGIHTRSGGNGDFHSLIRRFSNRIDHRCGVRSTVLFV